jgi:RNA polymerase sigma factor (sigma-70 family)
MPSPVSRLLRSLPALNGDAAAVCDAQLLERFLDGDREAAFAALVRRHGPLVLSVCRRVLGQAEDAEDAFQATFLVLARRVKSVRKVDSLAAWLHGVALRLARKMRASACRRRRHEQQATLPQAPETPDLSVREVWAALHEELARLPEPERQPLLLCHLEGLTQEQAARQLGWPRGTLKRRLERGRARLRAALTRRGCALGIPLLTGLVANPADAQVPVTLGHVIVRAAILGSSPELSAGLVSERVLSLVQGELATMTLSRLQILTALVLALALSGAGAWLHARNTAGATERPTAVAPAETPGKSASPRDRKPARPKTDLERLRGTWRVVRGELGGRELPLDAIGRQRMTFQEKALVWSAGDQEGMKCDYQLDSTKRPGHIDIQSGRLDLIGIYKIDGRKLSLALAPADQKQRPDGFVTNQGAPFMVYELERVVAKGAPAAPSKKSRDEK